MPDNTLERYQQDVIEALIATDNATRGDFIEPICRLLQRYVAHDLEWAALAVETLLGRIEAGTVMASAFEDELRTIIESIRERGRIG
jgi:hypothetical protein